MSFKTDFHGGRRRAGRGRDRPGGRRSARALDAHLAVLVLGIAPPPPASPYGVVSNDLWAGEIREGQDEAQTRAAAIEARLAGTAALRCSVERAVSSTAAPWRRSPPASPATPT